ncbi:PD40 domain-containing protein [Chryseolinea lacunae]|uniref:PD40 domain-containing protein n=1 Tax=Chryseolinea lacunae TaxID=2801331 RepID=A0ABS1KSW6_9BACT|nr:PD40 domain-containing protein [Chryseolinea lacunae]MBL0742418.1 PD40 domain-containing protein [Chryseolinea lacunae]
MNLRSGLRLLSALFLLSFFPAKAQQSRENFGKNRIQYRQFDWVYLSGENFDVYYYDARKAVAQEALEYLEGEFDRVTDLIGYPPYFKTKVFLYNSLSDLRQSNVGLNHNVFNVGGETEFIKPYVEVAHLGTAQEFKDELLFQISDLMIHEMMFGGNLKEMFQSSILMNLPDWFVDGSSLYVARGWSMEMDDYIRQLMKTRRAKRATKLSGKEAGLVGQSIWNFIAEKYGKSSVANILNYTRVTRNEEKSILITLGISFKQLLTEWQKYYSDMEGTVSKSYISPEESTSFTQQHNKTTEFTTVKISPDGRNIAYAENDRGRFIVKVRSLETGREKTILSGGSKVIKQRVDYSLPLLAWSDASTLGVIGVKNGQYVFWLYDFNTRTKLPRQLERFSNIRSFSFSGNGRLIILSADFEGKSDLFLLSSKRDRVRRLTNDLYDDLDPSFIPNTNRIVFSSNRTTDTLRANAKPQFEQLTNNYNLFVYDLDSTKFLLTRLTNTLSKDHSPQAIDEDNFYYLSDQRGIVNLFKFNRPTGIYSQVTNYNSSIKDIDISFPNQTMAMVMTEDMKQNIFVDRSFNLSRQVFTPATRRKDLQQARVIRERRKQEENKNMSIRDLLNSRLKEAQPRRDTTPALPQQNPARTDSTIVQNGPPPAVSPDKMGEPSETPTRQDEVNTDNYAFGDEPKKPEVQRPVQTTPADATKQKPTNRADAVNTDNYVFGDEEKKPAPSLPVVPADTTKTGQAKKPDVVNTDNYTFEDEAVKAQPSESFLTRYMKAREKSRITGPFPYESKFSSNNLVTSLVVDPLRGLGVSIETQMNDMLENYRFFGGLMTSVDLRNGDFFAEFQYLKSLIDFGMRVDRKGIRWAAEPETEGEQGELFHYSLNRVELSASLPISDRIRFTIKPFGALARSVDLGEADYPTAPPTVAPVNNLYAGIKSELVYDNSVSTGLNLIEGTRAKISFQNYQGLQNADLGFSQASIDVRHYQKIYREIVFAVRGFAGTFFGNSPKKYLLGGMDNWLFNKTRKDGKTSEGQPNPLGYPRENQDILFVEYATSLRGFDYATLFGNSVMMANAEFRVPLVKALSNGPISSNFLRNMQFIAFYDIGTAWSGKPPFSSGNSVSYEEITQAPFKAQIKNYLNPWLYSYGLGARTVLLGYYMKFDVAWPVENYEVSKPRLHVTLGFDF